MFDQNNLSGTRIIYTRFHTKSAVLLRRIKNQNIEAEIQKLMVETLGHLQYKQKVFTEVALGKRPLLERTAFDFDTILLGVAGILQGN